MGSSNKNSTSEVEIIRYQVLIPVTEVQVRSANTKEKEEVHFLWELIHLKSQLQRRSEKVYQLSNSTNELRNSFLRTIRQIIRESVRNMTVPTTKPSGGGGGGAREKSPRNKDDQRALTRTLSAKKRSSRQRHSAGEENQNQNFRTRSRTVADGMDDMMSTSVRDLRGGDGPDKLRPLGAPKALSLSTASSLSNSSSSSAKLIQSSNPPASYHPQQVQASSPVWKPRENSFEKAATLPPPQKGKDEAAAKQYFVYDEYGSALYVIPPTTTTAPKKAEQQQQQQTTSMSSKQSDC